MEIAFISKKKGENIYRHVVLHLYLYSYTAIYVYTFTYYTAMGE